MATLKTVADAADAVRSAVSELTDPAAVTLDRIHSAAIGVNATAVEFRRTAELAGDAATHVSVAVTDSSDRIARAVELACWSLAACLIVTTVRDIIR